MKPSRLAVPLIFAVAAAAGCKLAQINSTPSPFLADLPSSGDEIAITGEVPLRLAVMRDSSEVDGKLSFTFSKVEFEHSDLKKWPSYDEIYTRLNDAWVQIVSETDKDDLGLYTVSQDKLNIAFDRIAQEWNEKTGMDFRATVGDVRRVSPPKPRQNFLLAMIN